MPEHDVPGQVGAATCLHCGRDLERLGESWVDGDGWFNCAKNRRHEPVVWGSDSGSSRGATDR